MTFLKNSPTFGHQLKVSLVAIIAGGISAFAFNSHAANPFITSIYAADPSAHVWADRRLYVYASHDMDPARGCDLMDRYHVFPRTIC